MKTLLSFIFFLSLALSKAQPPCQFALNSPGPFSITCSGTLVLVSASPSTLNFTWNSLTNPPVSGTIASFTNTGTYTVVATGSACSSSSQTFAVVNYTTPPTTSVTPLVQNTNCSNTTAVTFTGTVSSPTANIQNNWYSPINPPPGGPPIASSNGNISLLQGNVAPGIYTLITTNLVNGCSTAKTVTVTSSNAYPTFTITSPTNFSLGCFPLNQTTLNIPNAASTNTPPGVVTYTFLPPGFSGPVSQTLGPNSITITNLPGSWTVIVQDESNFCRTELVIPVVVNTIAPHVTANMFTQMLTCKNPTVLATGSSSTSNTAIEWIVPLPPPNNLASSTLVIGTPSVGPPTSSTAISYGTYTVIATNTLNGCKSQMFVNIDQNFRPPTASINIASTTTMITCKAGTDPVILNASNSQVNSGIPNAFVTVVLWQGPSPQYTASGVTTYSAFVPGLTGSEYTLTVKDSENGCTAKTTKTIGDGRYYPVITNPLATATMQCGSGTSPLTGVATLSFALTGISSGMNYLVFSYPQNTSFNPPSANDTIAGTASGTVTVNRGGTYIYRVTHTISACVSTGTYIVVPGHIEASFEPSPSSGYAPLEVLFFNNSNAGNNFSGITSIWSFGNGTSITTTANTAPAVTYTSPGTYTATLYVLKGACADTLTKIIKVDIPSKIEVPNVFTPNGDGNNDQFFLKTRNLTEIHALIFDRWGKKVYEVNSSNGNILWDGKNLQGGDCPPGVYFYAITAKGRDHESYTNKGTVSLFR